MQVALSIPPRLAAVLALLFATAGHAFAQEDARSDPRVGPFISGAIGYAHYTAEPGLVSCRCASDEAVSWKLGGGYRFGVASVEAWLLDFGKAKFAADGMNPETTSRLRAFTLGGALTARFGRHVEVTWRLGAAQVHLAGDGPSAERSVRPVYGAAVGWRLTEALSAELSFDLLHAKDNAGTTSLVSALSLGTRYRF